jgi:glycosyltransferase involved in cell wall biosynthesis
VDAGITYRLIWPALVLKAQGHDVHVVVPKQRGGGVGLNGMQDQDGNLVSLDVPDVDVMVMQRITDRKVAQAIPMIRAKGVAVVIDMDDDLSCIHPANPAYAMMHPNRGQPGHSWHHAAQACRDATAVTVATDALLRTYAPHGRGRVLHNCVPARYLDIPRVDSDVIGWAGSVHSHPDDLQTVGTALARLTRAGRRFGVVGPGAGVRDALRLDTDPQATGVVDIGAWPSALATLGVGIAPLADTAFNASKSWLKAAEYAACGVPWVASPRPEYRHLHARGCGLLADKPRDWQRKLAALATNPARRQELSEAGRVVAANLTIEGNAWRWLEAWTDAYRLQRQAAASAFSRI